MIDYQYAVDYQLALAPKLEAPFIGLRLMTLSELNAMVQAIRQQRRAAEEGEIARPESLRNRENAAKDSRE